ncbi:MAG: peptidyl-prolyl cis-trans isomerase [Alphaproteobacteria bacterium]
MLKQMRSGAHSKILKYFFFGLLLMGTVGLALFGVQDVFRGGFHTQTVAKIGRDKISKVDLDRMVQDTLRARKISQEDAYRAGLPLATLEREINSRLFIRAANDLGIIIDDVTVRRQIDDLIKPMKAKGMTDKQALENILYAFNVTENRLVASLKAEIAVEKLSHALADGASAPRQMVDDFMKYRYEWRRGDYFKLSAADAEVKDPSDAELQALYKAEIQNHYMQPEYRSFSVLLLDAQSLAGGEKKPQLDAKAFYEQNKAQFAEPEKRVVTEIAADEALAQSIYSDLSGGKDVKKVVAEAPKGKVQLTTDTYTLETFIPDELAADVFKASSGALLPPKKGPFGKMIIARIDKVIPATPIPFAEAKDKIEKMLASERNSSANSEALFARADEVNEMIGGGKTLAEVAQHYNMKTVAFDKIDLQGNDASGKPVDKHGIPDLDKVLKAVWGLEKGAASQPVASKTGEIMVAELHDVQPAQAKPFDSVRSDVVRAWKEKQAGLALDTKGAKIMERLNMGEPLEKVAESFGKSIQKTTLIQRQAAQQKGNTLEPGVMLALFSIDKIGRSTAVPGPGAITVLRLAERKIDAPKELSKEDVESMQAMLSQALQNDILEQFRKSLMAKYDVTIDEQALKEMYSVKQGAEEEQQ